MRISVISLALAASLSLTACQGWTINGIDTTGVNSGNEQSWCKRSTENRDKCIIGGFLLAGTVVLLLLDDDDKAAPQQQPSDERLKEDIVPVTKLENGIQLYSFNYKGDPRRFIGVIAQDLLKDEKFRGAVSEGPDGFYRVDYTKLGMRVTNPAEMLEASLKASAKL